MSGSLARSSGLSGFTKCGVTTTSSSSADFCVLRLRKILLKEADRKKLIRNFEAAWLRQRLLVENTIGRFQNKVQHPLLVEKEVASQYHAIRPKCAA